MKKTLNILAATLLIAAPFSASAIDFGSALGKATAVSDALSGKPATPTATETAVDAASNILAGGDMTTQLMSAMQNPQVQAYVLDMLSMEQIQSLITQFPGLLTAAQ